MDAFVFFSDGRCSHAKSGSSVKVRSDHYRCRAPVPTGEAAMDSEERWDDTGMGGEGWCSGRFRDGEQARDGAREEKIEKRAAQEREQFGPWNKMKPSPKRTKETILVLEIGKDKNKEIYRQQHIAIRSLREALVCVLVVRRWETVVRSVQYGEGKLLTGATRAPQA